MVRSSLAARALLAAALLPLALADAGAQRTRSRPAADAAARPAYDPALLAGLSWRHVGPFRGGRVTTVTGVPSEPHTFYFGSTGGGVWKTTDAGKTWRNVSDRYFAVASMGAIRVAPSDPRVVWAGTGSDGIRSNVSIGRGIYRSDDAGETWRFMGLRDVGQIGAVEIHPTNPDLVYVAALGNPFARNPERGVFRTRDGGKSWEKVLYLSDSTGAIDLELNPADPNEIYATMWRGERKPWTVISGAREGGIYKSTDGGTTWRKLTRGLPQGLFGKADLAVSAANPNRVYALVEAPEGEGGLYRSDDRGESWTLVSMQRGLINRPFYYINVDADPTNADRVFVGTESFFVSTDGGKSWETLETPHVDNHDLWINPRDPRIWIQANDGGVNVTLDDGKTWSTQYNQPTAEIYQVNVDDRFPYRLYGAQQDNTTLILPSLPLAAGRPDDWMQQWIVGAGCETGPIVPHPTNPDTVYGACKGQFSRLSLRTGQESNYWVGAQYMYGHDPKDLKLRFQRVAPIEISPHDPRVIYHASQFVHRTTDEGVTWETISPDLTAFDPATQGISGEPITRDVTGEEFYSTIYALRESPRVRGLLWAGANDGPVHVSRDGGRTWTNVTPKDLPPGGRVQHIEPSRHADGTAYIAVYRYLLGDFRPYIYRTTDFGRSWTRLTTGTNGIAADEPTRVVREDPERPGLLYAGTEFGVWVSFDDGARWQSLQLDLPHVPVTDMKVHRGDLVISTQGRGFWILDDLSPLRQLAPQVASSPVHFFAPRPAWRTRYPVTGKSETQPQYPTNGVHLDYWLAAAPAGELRLDILDSTGTLLRSFSSAGEGERASLPPERVGTPRLPKGRGLHRVTWDLTLPGAWTAGESRGRRRGGPLVIPGRYTARLTVGDAVLERPFEVRLDPRVAADGVTTADLAEQLALALQVRDAISEANRLVERVREARQATNGASADRLAAVERKLVTAPVRYSQPMLVDQLGYLYGLVTGADQKVGRDAIARFAELRQELDAIAGEVRQLLGAETAGVR